MNTNDEGFEKLIDSRIGDDESLQMLSNDKGVALLAFIGSYVPRRYNPSTSRRASISTIDEFGMEEALKSIRDASGGKKNPRHISLSTHAEAGLAHHSR